MELESGGQRLLVDLGLPLAAPANTPDQLPAVPGLLAPDPSLLGLLISHPHMDHYGLLAHLRPDLPVAMGTAGRRILEAAAPWVRDPVIPAQGPQVEDRTPFAWGPFRITPYLMDHSAFDAYGFLIEAHGRRVFYSGDFRAHGRTAWRFDRMLEHPPRDIEVLLMEGTTLGRDPQGPRVQTEQDLEADLVRAFRATEGLALVCASAQNIDRLVTLFRASKRSGRTFLIDAYTAAILEATGHPAIPQSHWDGVGLFVPGPQKRQIIRKGLFPVLDRHKRNRIFPEHLAEAAPRCVLLFRPSHQADLEAANALRGARIFYSLWEGYLDQEAGRDLQAWAAARGIPLQPCHTSGHASPADLRRFVEALDPRVLVPIHAARPDRFSTLFPRVVLRGDGEWFEANPERSDHELHPPSE